MFLCGSKKGGGLWPSWKWPPFLGGRVAMNLEDCGLEFGCSLYTWYLCCKGVARVAHFKNHSHIKCSQACLPTRMGNTRVFMPCTGSQTQQVNPNTCKFTYRCCYMRMSWLVHLKIAIVSLGDLADFPPNHGRLRGMPDNASTSWVKCRRSWDNKAIPSCWKPCWKSWLSSRSRCSVENPCLTHPGSVACHGRGADHLQTMGVLEQWHRHRTMWDTDHES